ncbi:hypothetical protein [uncultured Shewanella sp.]|uniref:pyroglutamyl-peptidase I family protein n=1 Tax=uncultured Shewanella sp. TaxID=173975 RepID=UPI00262B2154|nr:hypothetical protein [uncultured Shewanella sp.]
MKKVLLIGFEAHAPRYTYSAQSVVDTLHGLQQGKIRIYSRLIKETFFDSVDAVCMAMTEFKPDVVLMMGEYIGANIITLERIAHNFNDMKAHSMIDTSDLNEDNAFTAKSGPVAYMSSLPLNTMVKMMRSNGVPADISNSNGTLYGNHVFYGVLHYLSIHQLSTPVGWLNLPMLPEKATLPEYLGQPSMSLHTCIEGVKLAIQAAM